jgi:hypothetical protein
MHFIDNAEEVQKTKNTSNDIYKILQAYIIKWNALHQSQPTDYLNVNSYLCNVKKQNLSTRNIVI